MRSTCRKAIALVFGLYILLNEVLEFDERLLMAEVTYWENSHLSKDSGGNNISGGLVVVSSMLCW